MAWRSTARGSLPAWLRIPRSNAAAPGIVSNVNLLEAIGNTPLIRLERIDRGLPVPIYGKCEHLNPGGSVKDRIAKSIVLDAESRGVLKPGATLIEATAGNTGMGLALVAAVRGYRLVCVMPQKMSVDKRRALKALGAEVVITDNAPPDSAENFQHVAKRLAAEHGYFLTQQFENPANVAAHEHGTGEEIWQQLSGNMGAFVAGAGTGGTISGVGACLKRHRPGVRIVLADPLGSRLTGWVKTGELGEDGSYLVEGIGGSAIPINLHRTVIDDAIQVSDEESFAMARRLIAEEGMLVGGSAGTNVAAAVKLARSGSVDGPIVTVLCDLWDRYQSQPWLSE